MKLWNGRIARSYRKAMVTTRLDGVCRPDVCPYILTGLLPQLSDAGTFTVPENSDDMFPGDIRTDSQVMVSAMKRVTFLDYLPKAIDICVDSRCNLECVTCRTHKITQLPQDQLNLLEAVKAVIFQIGKDLRFINLANGEAFFSPFSLSLLRELNRNAFPSLKIDAVTNGILLTPRMWKSLGEGSDFIKGLDVSIDAATAPTYASFRIGGDWNRLNENLLFIRELRQSGVIERFAINFVITADNFREMPQFVTLAETLKVDKVLFVDLRDVRGMRLDYKSAAVHVPTHPFHKEFIEILKSPLFKKPFVILGSSAFKPTL